MAARRVMILGLDCVPPYLAFDRLQQVMPNLSRLRMRGSWGSLRSSTPPITVPAWTCMLTGRDPGELGLYGFQQPLEDSYEKRLVTALDVEHPRLWDLAGAAGRTVASLFVPPTYPPRPVHGVQVSCFLTPDSDCVHTYPAELGSELARRFGPYRMDAEEFRTEDRAPLLEELCEMTRQHFDIADYVYRTARPDLLVMVTIGPDRFNHAFLADVDDRHRDHDPAGPFAGAGRRYYGLLDQQLGRMLRLADEETAVMVVSDHGARPLRGGMCINEWLIEAGFLVLHEYPREVTPLSRLAVDWSRTVAYGEGGYCGRIRLNLRGREPQGIVAPEDAEAVVAKIADGLRSLPGPDGEALVHRIAGPEAYRAQRGRPPELQVFVGDLDYRAIATVGHGGRYIAGNDGGPDGCNHDWDGIVVLAGAGVRPRGQLQGAAIYDVTKTALSLLGVPSPADLLGEDLSR